MRYRFLLVLLLLAPAAAAQDGEADWTNFDFVPGDTLLFYEDFASAYVGDFPAARLGYLDGALEVVERGGDRMLRTENEGVFRIPLPAVLPERFTIEFDVEGTDGRHQLHLWPADTKYLDKEHVYVVVDPRGSGLTTGKYNPGPKAIVETADATIGQRATVRISAEGDYLKMYVNERRVANVPKAPLLRTDGLTVQLGVYPHDDEALYIDNIRVAQGGRTRLGERLLADGHIVAAGLYFDTGRADLKPESTPTLLALKRTLDDHPDVRVRIEGHTDDQGSDAVNQPLSEARAQAVSTWLTDHGISDGRIVPVGLGSTRPIADNTTAEERARNRRVEVWIIDD